MPRDVRNILVVRLGAMGDIIHALPGVALLKQRFPAAHITWVVESTWVPLLGCTSGGCNGVGNGLVDRVVLFQRDRFATWDQTRKALRSVHYDLAVDFQGLIKSALIAHFARPERIVGFGPRVVREKPASWFYSTCIETTSIHVVDQALDLAAGAARASGHAACGSPNPAQSALAFPFPPGAPEGVLPVQPFALACPLAGWESKQWPLEYYEKLANLLRERLNVPMVLNGPPGFLQPVAWAVRHESGIPGLIDATRRAALVIGVDSGPLHLAAALQKSGAAIFGPTDPSRNGPRGGNFQVFRAEGVKTTHRRGDAIDPSMRAITPEQVFAALATRVRCHA